MKITDSKNRLRELLNESGDSQNEMARKAGLTKSAISNYLNGTREPRQDAISKICEAYNVNPSWLMGLDAPKTPIKEKEVEFLRARLDLLNANSGDTNIMDRLEKAMAKWEEELKENPELAVDRYVFGNNESIIEIKEATNQALRLFQKYQDAPENVRSAIDALLGSVPPQS